MRLTIEQATKIRQHRESFQLVNIYLHFPAQSGVSVGLAYGKATQFHYNVTLPTGEFCEPPYLETANFIRNLEVTCANERTHKLSTESLEYMASVLENNFGLEPIDINHGTYGTLRSRIRNSTYCEYTKQLVRLLRPDVCKARPQQAYDERPVVEIELRDYARELGFAFVTNTDIGKMFLRVNLNKSKNDGIKTAYNDELSQEFAEAIYRQNFDLVHVDELTFKKPLEDAIDELGILLEKYTSYIAGVLESHSEVPSDLSNLLTESFESNLFTVKLG